MKKEASADVADIDRVVIVGAGIAGLVAAISLSRSGKSVSVLEQRLEWRSQEGIGLTLVGNALRALATLGLEQICIERGMPEDHFILREVDGALREISPDAMLGGQNLPGHVAISRPVLLEILADAALASGVEIIPDVRVVDMDSAADGATAITDNGQVHAADLLVAADGINSIIRQKLFPSSGPQHSGQGAWRAALSCSAEIVTTNAFLDGPAGLVGLCPIAPGKAYVYVIEEAGADTRFPEADLEHLLRQRLSGYTGLLKDILPNSLSRSEITFRPLHWHLLPPPWHAGRIVLIGDAVHSNPPVLAQGAAMGIEDAIVLAEELSSPGTIEDALRRYVERRFARVEVVIRNSVALSRSRVQDKGVEARAKAGRLFHEVNSILEQPL